jgi:hypothetical protein
LLWKNYINISNISEVSTEKSKAVERDKGKIDIGTALAVAVGMEVMVATEVLATMVKGAGDFAEAGAAR